MDLGGSFVPTEMSQVVSPGSTYQTYQDQWAHHPWSTVSFKSALQLWLSKQRRTNPLLSPPLCAEAPAVTSSRSYFNLLLLVKGSFRPPASESHGLVSSESSGGGLGF